MCNFNKLSEAEKLKHHKKLLQCANSFGGINFFLLLLEAIRETKPNPLLSENSEFKIDIGTISWNKVIFNDKLQLLLKARVKESERDNFLPKKTEKNYKKILNVVKTLTPIVFTVKPSDKENGNGFFFQAFYKIDENKSKIDPLFDAIFFCSVDSIKKILNYSPKV